MNDPYPPLPDLGPSGPDTPVSVRIRGTIENRGWTMKHLSDLTRVPYPVIVNIVTGRRPGHRHLPVISEVLGVSLGWLITGKGPY